MVSPSSFRVRLGWAMGGLAIEGIEFLHSGGDGFENVAGAEREAAVAQDRAEFFFRSGRFQNEQRPQLGVGVLLAGVADFVLSNKDLDWIVEGESPNAHVIHRHTLSIEYVERFANRGITSTNGDYAATRPWSPLYDGLGKEGGGLFMLAQEPVHHFLVFVGDFGVGADLV